MCGMLWAFRWAPRGWGNGIESDWANLTLTRLGVGPRRAPGTPGAACWDPGPYRLLAGREPTTVPHLMSPVESLLLRRKMGARKGDLTLGWDPERRCRSRHLHSGDTHHTEHTHHHTHTHSPHTNTLSVSHRAVAAETGPRPSFRRCRPLSYT